MLPRHRTHQRTRRHHHRMQKPHKSEKNWYFHPLRFIEHLQKVELKEFNPYEGYLLDFKAEGGITPGNHIENYKKQVGYGPNGNPGFARLALAGRVSVEYPEYQGVRYAKCTSPFNISRVKNGSTAQDIKSGAHSGIDLATAGKSKIVSLIHGTVWAYTEDDDYGKVLIVKNDKEPILYMLAHIDSSPCKAMQSIQPHQEVAVVGNTGEWGGAYPHLHLEVYDCPGGSDGKAREKVLNDISNKEPGSGPDAKLVWSDDFSFRKKRRNPFNHSEKYKG